jgi:hypothetical protein
MESANTAINWTAFPVTLVCASIVLYRYKLDPSAIFIIVTYLVAMVARIFLGKPDFSLKDIIIPASATVTWGILFYFVHQMSLIRIKLEASSK